MLRDGGEDGIGNDLAGKDRQRYNVAAGTAVAEAPPIGGA